MDQRDGFEDAMEGDTLCEDTMATAPDLREPVREAAAMRLAAACASLYRRAVASGDPALYDAAAVLGALQEHTAAEQPTPLLRVYAALETARHAHRLDAHPLDGQLRDTAAPCARMTAATTDRSEAIG